MSEEREKAWKRLCSIGATDQPFQLQANFQQKFFFFLGNFIDTLVFMLEG